MSAPVQSCQPIPEPVRQHTPTLVMGYIVCLGPDDEEAIPYDEAVIHLEGDEDSEINVHCPGALRFAPFIVDAVNSHATLKAQVKELKSTLREIKAKTEGGRPTVNPENAFEHWGKLNAALVSIRGLVREALDAKP